MSEHNYPRVSDILHAMVLFDEDRRFLWPRYLRRGRLVDSAATMIALNLQDPQRHPPIPEAWWYGHSGERDDDRVNHEECRPYLEGARQFLSEHHFILVQSQIEVVNHVEKYIGHPDWYGHFDNGRELPDAWKRDWIIDLKAGPPPPEFITVGESRRLNPLWVAYRRQTQLYKMASKRPYNTARRASLHLFDSSYRFVEHADYRDEGRCLIMVRSFHDMQQFRRGE
jgi:hypothetical protein